jgi:hypothetical protein
MFITQSGFCFYFYLEAPMLTQSVSTSIRALIAATALSVASNAAVGATVFSLDANPFPVNAVSQLHSSTPVNIGGAGTTSDFYVRNLALTNSSFAGGDQTLTYNADLVFTLDDGAGGAIGPVTLHSTNFGALLTGRTSDSQTGTFAQTLIQGSFFSGMFGGNSLVVELNPNLQSTGFVNIAAVPGGFNVSNNKTVNPQFRINGGPPNVVPPLQAQFIPEPATALLMAPGLLAIGMRRRVVYS